MVRWSPLPLHPGRSARIKIFYLHKKVHTFVLLTLLSLSFTRHSRSSSTRNTMRSTNRASGIKSRAARITSSANRDEESESEEEEDDDENGWEEVMKLEAILDEAVPGGPVSSLAAADGLDGEGEADGAGFDGRSPTRPNQPGPSFRAGRAGHNAHRMLNNGARSDATSVANGSVHSYITSPRTAKEVSGGRLHFPSTPVSPPLFHDTRPSAIPLGRGGSCGGVAACGAEGTTPRGSA